MRIALVVSGGVDRAGDWDLAGARIHNVGSRHPRLRAVRSICAMHRSAPFALVHAIWLAATVRSRWLRLCSLASRASYMSPAANTPVIEMISQLGLTAERVPHGVDLDTWPARASAPLYRQARANAESQKISSM